MIDSIPAVTFDMVAKGAGAGPAGGGSSNAAGQVSVHDVARFERLHRAPAAETEAAAPAAKAGGPDNFAKVLESLQSLNGRVADIGTAAESFAANRQELTPGDMVQMTMKAHEFMFQCELTANVANRSSEGVQQLFRQQS